MNQAIVLGATMWARGIYLAICMVIPWRTHVQDQKKELNIYDNKRNW
ncbi:hypothetical protein PHET_09416 [Paragonimus heterotremus]|uniref:Uncharacterized protein n=1 Tax=Paragonimus heterotremus TaxID=100268 RepID=A0A8J4ST57_9TREM|nr:hypothetical protein PHET_09416 [Paragonimus heterotremus]